MRKSLLFCIIAGLFLLVGCVPTGDATPSGKVPTTLPQLEAKLTTANAEIAANKSAIATNTSAIAGIAGSEVTTAQLKAATDRIAVQEDAGYYTKAQVDARVNAIIQAKIDAGELAIPGSSSSGSNGVASTSGEITVTVYSVSPSIIYSGDPDEYDIFLEVVNGTDRSERVLLTGTLSAETFSSSVNTTGTKFETESPYIQDQEFGTGFSPSDGEDCVLIIATSGRIIIGAGATLLIPVEFTLEYDDDKTYWDMDWSIRILP